MPTILTNNGFRRLEDLFTTLDNMENETLHKEFMTKDKVIDPSILSFMEHLKSMATGKDLT